MSSLLLVVIATCIFIFSYYSFLLCEKKQASDSLDTHFSSKPLSVFIIWGFLGCLCCSYVIPNQNDALTTISSWTIPLVFASAATLSLCLYLCHNKFLQFLLLSFICSVNVLLLPDDISLTGNLLPAYIEKGILIVFWILFAWFYNILNSVDGVLPIQSLSLTIGLILMYILGIMPELYTGWISVFAVILLSFTLFNNYPAVISLNNNGCRLIGFFIGWLVLLASIEGNASCALILSMYYIYETVIAIIKKLSFQKRFKNLEDNTFYNQLNALGVSPKNICEFIVRINLILLLLAGFQIYAPNQYTMGLIAFFAVFWMTSRATSSENFKRPLLISSSILSALFGHKKKKTD